MNRNAISVDECSIFIIKTRLHHPQIISQIYDTEFEWNHRKNSISSILWLRRLFMHGTQTPPHNDALDEKWF